MVYILYYFINIFLMREFELAEIPENDNGSDGKIELEMMEYDPDRVQDAARKSSLRWCDDVQRMKDLGLMFVVVV